jgi:SpoIID/LytB domain protein
VKNPLLIDMQRRLAPILVLATAIALAPSPAGATSQFQFYGSGWGHGIGYSQFGGLGLAQVGWGAERIVKHYYDGVKVNQHTPPVSTIKVGLLQYRSSTKLVASFGSYELELKSGKHVDTVTEGQSRIITVVDGRYRVKRANGQFVGDLWGGTHNHLLARRQGDARISVPDWGGQIARGKIQFDIVGGSKAHVLAVIPVEHYVYGIAEVPGSWPVGALRAQAILARSYAYWRLAGPKRSGCSCDVLTTPSDQAYVGWSKESGPDGDRWVSAVKKTNKRVVTHKGKYVYTPYSSSSGGHTEAIEKVWPGAAPSPYLNAECDPRDDNSANPNVTWSTTMSAPEVTSKLGLGIGTVTNFKGFKRGKSGRVTYVRVVGTSGSKVVEGWDVRSELGLKDSRFSVNKNLNITGPIRTKYDSENCKPGRATGAKKDIQGGAYQRFQKGRIYRNNQADKTVWVRGAVLKKYLDVGGHKGKLGLPVGYSKVPGGHKGVFDGGTIVCTSGCTVSYS